MVIGFRKSLLAIALLFTSTTALLSQQSFVFTEGYPDYKNAVDLYEKEKFLAAQEYFEKTMKSIDDVHSEVRIEAEFFHALCAIELFHANAEALLLEFIERHPESSHLLRGYFNLAKFQFRKRRYEDVIIYLEAIDPLDLSQEERAEYHFKKGYSHFQLEEFDQAAQHFYEIKDTDNVYVSAARYYYGHISYQEGNYQTAFENLDKIKDDPLFGSLVPYYFTQIYYRQGKYEELLTYAPVVLDSAPPKREMEIRKLIGDAYYETGKYKEAIPYLEAFQQRNQLEQAGHYQLGYAYFNVKDYSTAISSFQEAIGENDSLSQLAYYYIGESNVKTDHKQAARNAFRRAHQLNIDPEITEDALFNYAKTAYELSYHPYDDAIKAFEEYLNAYPNSSKLDDAYEYLVGVYYTTKNYEEALKSIDRIERKDIKLLQAKQRLAFYRGIELYNEGNFSKAKERFQLSMKNNYDPSLYAAATFWLAQSHYQLKEYQNADNFYSDFLASPRARNLPYYTKGYYHLAYTFYKRQKYHAAIFWFREYADKADSENEGLITDALLRTGDCYFIQKDYRDAVIYYDKAAEVGTFDKDYALLQSAISSGVLGDYLLKTKKLAKLVKEEKSSLYMDDALFELGKTFLVMDKESEALSYFNQLVNDFPNSNFIAEAHLKIGLIHYNQNNDEMAMNSFNKVVKDFSGSDNAKEALDKIRKIFIDRGDAKGFQDYANGVPFADISQSELDSTAYVIAENSYLEGNCEKATRDFTNYLKQYPKGLFQLNAHYYRGDCEAKADFYEEAIRDFEHVISLPRNKFTDKAVKSLVWLYDKAENYKMVISASKKLLEVADRKEDIAYAEQNLMHANFQEENYQEASTYANLILQGETVDEKLRQQAQLILSKSNFEQEDYQEALNQLNQLAEVSNDIGAEAKYLMAKINYLQGNYMKSDTIIYRLVDQVPSSPYWIAKGFILLADNFIAKEDVYNARLTFQSVIDNADNEELISIAKDKLKLLNKSAEAKDTEKSKKGDSVEVDFNPGTMKEKVREEPDTVRRQQEPLKEEDDEE